MHVRHAHNTREHLGAIEQGHAYPSCCAPLPNISSARRLRSALRTSEDR